VSTLDFNVMGYVLGPAKSQKPWANGRTWRAESKEDVGGGGVGEGRKTRGPSKDRI
jgi:hypothetical protein